MSKISSDYSRSVNDKEPYTSAYTSHEVKCKQETFASRLREARKQRSLSQKELGHLVGVSAITIQNYEGGQLPKGEYLIALSRELGCSTDWLLLGEGPKLSQVIGRGARLAAEDDEPAQQSEKHIPEKQREGKNTEDEGQNVSSLLLKTAKILESKTVYSQALSNNIDAFYDSVLLEEEVTRLREQQESIKNDMEEFRQELAELRSENQALKDKLEAPEGSRRDQPPLEGTG